MSMRVVVPVVASTLLLPLVLIGLLGAAEPAKQAPEGAKGPSKYDVGSYRKEGQAGVDRFFEEHATAIASDDAEAVAAADAICGQFECKRNKLFWHTDLEAAKAQAAREKQPILSLHLLGRFDEQLSCANSRFFRKVLYADPSIRGELRNRYVLHWKSVRPVPKITIDFGDGRKMERTITGNSAHYVLDASGRPLDVIPGMYSPQPFFAALKDAAALSESLTGLDEKAQVARVAAWHKTRLQDGVRVWRDALAEDGVKRDHVDAKNAYALELLRSSTTDEDWKRIARRDSWRGRFDENVRKSIRAPSAWDSGQIAVGKAMVENPMVRAVQGVEATILQDSVQNELHLHTRVHSWFASESGRTSVTELATLNERVYRELFLAPLSDPWYGLEVPTQWEELDGTITTVAAVPSR